MSSSPTGQRPGGLTALAVLNFIFGGIYALAALGAAAFLGLAGEAKRQGAHGEVVEVFTTLLYIALALYIANAFLLIGSGVGYLKQKRSWGKMMGTAYGILGIIGAVVAYLSTKEFGINNIIGLVYPVLTLTLLNTVFADDFPNP